jgi:hypothetical protein
MCEPRVSLRCFRTLLFSKPGDFNADGHRRRYPARIPLSIKFKRLYPEIIAHFLKPGWFWKISIQNMKLALRHLLISAKRAASGVFFLKFSIPGIPAGGKRRFGRVVSCFTEGEMPGRRNPLFRRITSTWIHPGAQPGVQGLKKRPVSAGNIPGRPRYAWRWYIFQGIGVYGDRDTRRPAFEMSLPQPLLFH